MCRKLFFLLSLVLVLGLVLTCAVQAEPIAWYRLDDGAGNIATDSSGYGNDGTLQGSPQWVDGIVGSGALELTGSAWVEINSIADDLTDNDFSVSAWIKTTMTGDGNVIGGNTDGSSHEFIWGVDGGQLVECASPANVYDPPINDGEWHHIAYVRDGTTAYVYTDGELVGTETPSGDPANNMTRWSIGQEWDSSPSDFFTGTVDDVRFDNEPLSDTEILSVMSGQPWPFASKPEPKDGSLLNDTWVSLSWSSGDFAVSHDVYIGENFDEVDNGTGDTFRGNQASNFFVVGFPGFPYPDGLVPGTTYYWRIDEVNEAEPNSPWKGAVWSFSIPPKTAYNPDPADGADSVDKASQLRWTGGFGAKLHTVHFGNDYDTVNDAAGGVPQGTTTYNPGALEDEKIYYWRVDEFDAPLTHKGDVWGFSTTGAVSAPQPANGGSGVQMVGTLSWTAAATAVSHDVYLGTDKDAVRNATSASPEFKGNKALGSESLDPGKLAWESDYYWRVDAVYNSGPVKGLVWGFTTADFISVDDFESYNDIDPPDPASNRIFESWIDGFGTTDNGALVGNDLPPYAEQTAVHGGIQSMPYRYDNANKTSEATLTLTYPRDWTEEGVTKLSLWFRGSSANAADKIYVALNGSAVVYHADAAATQKGGWNQWVIDLQAFADQGVDLANVNTITIGVGTKGSPAAGGAGQLYFDDIRLTR